MQGRTRGRKEEFNKARREADKTCRKKKRAYENEQRRQMGEQFKINSNNREAYRYVRKIREGYKLRTNLCRRNDEQIGDITNIKQNWRNYFQELLGGQVATYRLITQNNN